jgi:hypothetical protein
MAGRADELLAPLKELQAGRKISACRNVSVRKRSKLTMKSSFLRLSLISPDPDTAGGEATPTWP